MPPGSVRVASSKPSTASTTSIQSPGLHRGPQHRNPQHRVHAYKACPHGGKGAAGPVWVRRHAEERAGRCPAPDSYQCACDHGEANEGPRASAGTAGLAATPRHRRSGRAPHPDRPSSAQCEGPPASWSYRSMSCPPMHVGFQHGCSVCWRVRAVQECVPQQLARGAVLHCACVSIIGAWQAVSA